MLPSNHLIRIEFNFAGVVVTDCLEMEAVAMKYGTEGGPVEALKVGTNIVMICHTMERQRGAIEAFYEAKFSRISVCGSVLPQLYLGFLCNKL